MVCCGSIPAQYAWHSTVEMFVFLMLLLASIDINVISATACSRAQLYSVVPKTDRQLDFLRALEQRNQTLDFWLLTKLLNEEVHILVPATDVAKFREELANHNLEPTRSRYNASSCENNARAERNAQYRATNSLDFTSRYLNHNEMNKYIDYLARKYSEIVAVKTVGYSYEKRPLRTVTISSGSSSSSASRAIFIDAGIHAREWIAPATALYVINRLVQHANENRDLLNNLTWIVLPLVNPDGYEYSLTSNKYWRKTRRPFKRCLGTDGNRNFGYHWAEKGASRYECAPTFAGPKPFSETETQTVRNVLLSHNNAVKFYLTLHSYGRLLLYPWGYKKDLAPSWRAMDAVARAGQAAMRRQHNVNYKVGGAAKLLYEAAGGSDDWALAVARIPVSMTMELPGDERGFHPATGRIKPFLEEAFTGIRAMALRVLQLEL